MQHTWFKILLLLTVFGFLGVLIFDQHRRIVEFCSAHADHPSIEPFNRITFDNCLGIF